MILRIDAIQKWVTAKGHKRLVLCPVNCGIDITQRTFPYEWTTVYHLPAVCAFKKRRLGRWTQSCCYFRGEANTIGNSTVQCDIAEYDGVMAMWNEAKVGNV